MTEQEWLDFTDPTVMLAFLHRQVIRLVDDLPSEMERQVMRTFLMNNGMARKKALFACGCCRQIWQVVTDERSRRAVEVAEASIDGMISNDQLHAANHDAYQARDAIKREPGEDWTETHIRRVAANACQEASSAAMGGRGFEADIFRAAHESADVATWIGLHANLSAARASQARLLHCIVGNPFKPLTTYSNCQLSKDGNAVELARAIYDERDFTRLPILEKVLQDAGCVSSEILGHCHQQGEHARGCWVIDLVLPQV